MSNDYVSDAVYSFRPANVSQTCVDDFVPRYDDFLPGVKDAGTIVADILPRPDSSPPMSGSTGPNADSP